MVVNQLTRASQLASAAETQDVSARRVKHPSRSLSLRYFPNPRNVYTRKEIKRVNIVGPGKTNIRQM